MSVETVAIISPGDMGHAVGRLLREHELRVVTCLAGRSGRTCTLAEEAGIEDLPSMEDLLRAADVILCITVSEVVPRVCQDVADALNATGEEVLFAECNAIAPQVAKEMEKIITQAGGRFVDASIIGGPPRGGSSPRFYAAGPNALEFEGMREFGMDVRVIGNEIGKASGIKMCYAAMTKGTMALYTELLIAAELMGLSEHLKAEFSGSQSAVLQGMERGLPGMPSNSRRWVSEMQEISATFGHLGLTPFLFKGVAEMYAAVGDTPLGAETPESMDGDRDLEETIRLLAEGINRGQD